MREAAPASLRGALRARDLFTLAFGAIIGVSWIVLVGDWIAAAGPIGALVAFALGGIALIPVGLCYARLGTRMPTTGGELVYAGRLFGPRTAYVTGCVLALLYVSLCAFEAISIAWIAATIVPGVAGPEIYRVLGQPIHAGDLAIGAVLTIALAFAHLRGADLASRVQDLLTVIMVLLTALFVAFGLAAGDVANLSPGFSGADAGASLWAVLGLLAFTPLFFAGFGTLPQALGETEEGARNALGRLMVLVLVASIVFYVAVIAATAMVLPARDIAGLDLAAAAAFNRAFDNQWLTNTVLLAGLLGLLTTWNAVLFAGARVLFAMGRAGLATGFLGAGSDARGAPANAVIAITVITLLAIPLGRQALLPIVALGGVAVSYLFLLVGLASWRLETGGKLVSALAIVVSVGLLGMGLLQIVSNGLSPELVALLIWAIVVAVGWLMRGTRARAATASAAIFDAP